MNRLIIIVLSLTCSLSLWAQPYPNRRVEIEARNTTDQMHVVPVESEGVVLFSEVEAGKYVFTRYNTDLQEDWHIECVVKNNLDLSKYVYRDKALYLLFSRFKSPEYQVVKVNVRAGFAEKIDIYSLDKLEVIDFDASGNYVFVAGQTRTEPVLLHMNLISKQTRVLPAAFKGKTNIQSIEFDSLTNTVNATFISGRAHEKTVIVKSFSPEGLSTRTITLTADQKQDYDLLTGKISSLNEDEELVIGTYGTQGPVYSRATLYNYYGYGRGTYYLGTADYSQGVYISKMQNSQQDFLKYYSFTDFKNFFKFLSPKQQERMEKSITRRKEQGRDLKLQYRLLVHDIIQRNGQYIMVAEAYYPEYRTANTNPYPGMWGYGYGYSSFNRSYPVFDGYVYTHAVIAGFDLKGNLLWDNSFEINDVKTYTLKEKVKVSFENENVMLAYNDDGILKTKVIRGNDVVEAKGNVPINTEHKGDKVAKSYTDEIEYWYGNHFLAWGFQKIRNDSDEQVKSRRNVFYFTKVNF